MNPIVQLAGSALPGERKYLLLAGAGVSKDAGLPTAWDVMLETAKLLYCSEREGTPSREELESWFVESPYAKMPYAEAIGSLYSTYPDQQAFLNTLIGGRQIGEAHRHIAELARRRVVRAVIPRSCLFLHRTPSYLVKAQSARFLRLLSKACGVPEDVFKQRVIPRCNQFVRFFGDGGPDDPIDSEILRLLGSRP
jgi:hypothetical protein